MKVSSVYLLSIEKVCSLLLQWKVSRRYLLSLQNHIVAAYCSLQKCVYAAFCQCRSL